MKDEQVLKLISKILYRYTNGKINRSISQNTKKSNISQKKEINQKENICNEDDFEYLDDDEEYQ